MNGEDMAYTGNYPQLETWLRKVEAFCVWQVRRGSSKGMHAFVECWCLPGGRSFLIHVASHKRGWDIYVPNDSNDVEATLRTAEERLGIR